jgi:hypothetical protein
MPDITLIAGAGITTAIRTGIYVTVTVYGTITGHIMPGIHGHTFHLAGAFMRLSTHFRTTGTRLMVVFTAGILEDRFTEIHLSF